ncbi:MAG: methionine--tRNA ligase [Candidatus Hepatoplasma vulgare]|nr:MAG: methionine--tRNA ligase [Candidatus Hepatoplasma sp.]
MKKKIKQFYVTTPIYYPNNNLHIGHAYTTVLADIINRYKKNDNYETYFLTGSDEHGEKIYLSAKKENKSPKEFVDKIIINFKNLWSLLGIEYDHFIRTTDETHINFVQESFNKLLEEKKIYKGKYSGLYCVYDEEFFTKTQAKNNKCPNCNRELIYLEEDTYFLKISEYKDWIKNKLETNDFLKPKSRRNELLKNFIPELKDLSITRENIHWGINLKNDEKQTIYVWFDALNNYLSTFKYKNSKWKIDDIWNKKSNVEILQIIGKEITRFHAIYWPIILKMYGYKLPQILSHGWIVDLDGKKMSKSMNNFIQPEKLIKKYGRDAIRFFLINNISIGEDGKFSEELLKKNINGILVNKYSNLINRMLSILFKKTNGIIFKSEKFKKEENEFDNLKDEFKEKLNSYSFFESSKLIINFTDKLNIFIDKNEIWNLKNKDLEEHLYFIFKEIWNLSILFSPILIDSSKKILEMFQEENHNFDNWNKNLDNKKIIKIDFLFKKID